MRYLKLTVAYDGANYNGFQIQKNALGIQEVLEKGLTKIMGEPIRIVAAGRTDAGVHAYEQVISFATNGSVPTELIPKAMIKQLPKDIVVVKAEDVPERFHARYHTTWKTYKYRIVLNKVRDPFLRNYAWQMEGPLDMKAMQECADIIVGTHDFSSFRNAGSSPTKPVRTMREAYWKEKSGGRELVFTITGDGFLYHMVRNLVGCMVKAGLGRITPADFANIMEAKDRKQAGTSAPPEGLYLYKVYY